MKREHIVVIILAIINCLLLWSVFSNYKIVKKEVPVKIEYVTDTIYQTNRVAEKKLENKVKKLKKTLRFRTYQRDSLQCKLDSFIYSIIKNQ